MHQKPSTSLVRLAVLLAPLILAACATAPGRDELKLTLSGSQEVPPVATAASGTGVVAIMPDRSVTGTFTTSGVAATMAHIHVGKAGTNGPVIIPLTRSGENGWVVPPGAKLNEEQYQRYRAGELYVNVHSKAHPGGEIRAQLVR